MATHFPEQQQPVNSIEEEIDRLLTIGERGFGDGEIFHPKAIAIEENTNNIYVTHRFGVSIFSEAGEFLKKFGHEHSTDPYGISINGKYVYLTDYMTNSVYQFIKETDIRLVTRVGGHGSRDGKFNSPTQVSVSTNGDVYIADCGNNRIQILNSSLHFLRSISHPSMTRPYDIKMTQHEIYVLSDQDPKCIHVFSHTGEKIRCLITQGEGKQVRQGNYFCMDANNNIIISDNGAGCVKVFSNEGMFQHTISEHGQEEGMLLWPQGVALTKDLKLVVASNNIIFGIQIFYSSTHQYC